MGLGPLKTWRDEPPHSQDEYRANDRSDETSAFTSFVPPDCLAKVRCYKSSNNPEAVVKMNPVGSYLFPGYKNFAITPATNPIMMVQIILIATSNFSLRCALGCPTPF